MANQLAASEINELHEYLYYLNLAELKNLSSQLGIPYGKKADLIARILHFLKTDEIQKTPVIPAASKAVRGNKYPLHPDTLILCGSYKNNLVTRNFFKQLIGPFFHFTAFGIDWINEQWLAGNPPTYQEFADYWQKEAERRTLAPENPKTEWAYINFIQRFMKQYPNASAPKVRKEWHAERQEKAMRVFKILENCRKQH